MLRFWKKKPFLGIGIGVGLLGALALAVRHAFRRAARIAFPENLSPAIFATRVSATTRGEMIYHVSGSGEPLVFLHGIHLGASSYEWSKIYPSFAMEWTVMAPDFIGFGESERPKRAPDATDHAESLADFLSETCGSQPAVLVASGLSAGIALILASRHPERVKRLILLLPTGLKESGRWRSFGLGMLARVPGLNGFVYRNYFSRTPFVRGWLSRFALGDPSRLTEEMVSVMSTCAQQYGAEHAILDFLRGHLAFDMESRLGRVPHPVTILWPDRASGFPLQRGESLARRLPMAKFRVVENCGILAALEVPDELAAILKDELDPGLHLEGAA